MLLGADRGGGGVLHRCGVKAIVVGRTVLVLLVVITGVAV